MRKTPSARTYKLLYARSGNICAFPKCNHPIFNDGGLYVAELCHIKAANVGGPRYDPAQTDDERRSDENLLFLCHRHHKEIDSTNDFSCLDLYTIKNSHESKFTEHGRKLTIEMEQQIEIERKIYWKRQHNKIFELDELKMKTDLDSSEIELYNDLIDSVKLILDYCKTCAESDSRETLEKDLKNLLEKADLDYSMIEKVPYYLNPFTRRNWAYHALGQHNLFSKLFLKLFQLRVRTFENLVKLNPNNQEFKSILNQFRDSFDDFYNNAYHRD